MKRLFLLKPGEITLKGENRPYFEAVLLRNMRSGLQGVPHLIRNTHGRIYLERPPGGEAGRGEAPWEERVLGVLRRTIGLSGFCRALEVDKDLDAMEAGCADLVSQALAAGRGPHFKIEARREDKRFPLDSYGLACELGDRLRNRFPELVVRLKSPDWVLNVEVREKVYLYTDAEQGEHGLPVGVQGRGLLLLSGGIDSPVAGYLMAKRGLRIDAVHFHSYPYTSKQAREKVEHLASILAGWTGRLRLFVVPFTEVQLAIRERAPAAETTLHSRAAMMRIADLLCRRTRANSLVTGESLGQVASQTSESIRFTGGMSRLPVFRPLIGLDKDHIIREAQKLGTYETSILPYEDCCVIFSPKHPLIKPNHAKISASWEALALEDLLRAALHGVEKLVFD